MREVNKKTRNAIENRLYKFIDKYGLKTTKMIVNRFFYEIRTKANLEKEISEKESELKKLKYKRWTKKWKYIVMVQDGMEKEHDYVL